MSLNFPTEAAPPQDIRVVTEVAHALQEELAVHLGQPSVCRRALLVLTYTKQVC
jgi:hypothetical protein